MSNPNGIFLSASIIVAFHAEFLTKFDRVYHVQCFYMEMQNMLQKEITVKMPPPVLQTQQVPMPTCKYEVLAGGPEGPPVFYATIGQMVYHKWTCESSSENQFCMVVHTCIVDDGNGDRVELIDEKGCARDKFLLQNLDYVSDLLVGKEAHVYKYADRPSMFFDCQITLNIKEPGQQYCDVPQCPDPPRRRRGHHESAVDINGTISEQNMEKNYVLSKDSFVTTSIIKENFAVTEDDICMTSFGMSAIAVINILMLLSSGLFFRNAYKKSFE
ncbi:cuticlin-1 [Ditylenchus destructor]|nr:cuticlin-1 [Ditylenchus destructor]